ncbi:unnamed protein product [Rotaria socialis]|uniref:Peptidase metallopeptidase domain-containing protein n=1 Tax=Rotaria socialis TaxID=392032 RepID=A0A821EXB7_9BILA|nr:unnamed protein product [Rotaria socialis]CAF4641190.1 unnamed protein product [Rotaria socialis]
MQLYVLLIRFVFILEFVIPNPINKDSLKYQNIHPIEETPDDTVAIKTAKDAFKFLTNFGYNPCENPTNSKSDNSASLSCHLSMEAMLESFQQKNRLPVTKKLDVHTLKLMNTPRCGVPDSLAEMTDRSSLWPKSRTLTWKLIGNSSHVNEVTTRKVIRQVFTDWADYSGLTFYEAKENERADFNLAFVSGDHSDGYPFNEPTSVLAHAFYPSDPKSRGNVHFNSAKKWSNTYDGFGYNIRVTATHEIGHSLGLPHSDESDSIMYPTYQIIQPEQLLSEKDRQRIRTLYQNDATSTDTEADEDAKDSDPSIVEVIYYPDGSRYEGALEDNKRHGKGSFYRANGEKYIGTWMDDEINGQGVYTWPSGTRYEGNWKDGKQYGNGTLHASDGRIYVGLWINGTMDGYGICTWSNRDRYEGYWKNSKRNGYGMHYFSDGRKYTGNWVNGMMNGHGIYTWPNRDRYEGDWENRRRHGYGTMEFSDGRKYVGYWCNNTMNGHGTYTWPNRDRYDGHWKNNRRDGYGIMDFADGRKYMGNWFNDTMNGQGSCTWPNGDRYDGYWKDGRKDGQGTYYFYDGRTSNGIWIDDIIQEPEAITTPSSNHEKEHTTEAIPQDQSTFILANGAEQDYTRTSDNEKFEEAPRRSIWSRFKKLVEKAILS